MKRILSLVAGLFSIVFTVPATGLMHTETAVAQGAPPEINMVVYGDAGGATVGQGIVAIVVTAGGSTVCGSGKVIDSSGPKYVVRVKSNSEKAGCGAPGRTVQFYITPTAGSGGRVATQTTTWTAGGSTPKLLNLTFGNPLTPRAIIAQAAKDGQFGVN
ncbi:hypothetical protein AYO38_02685 [bacterium SCGC AG-212-C10]|nr:hypothetical protein AYO38_02685 [bacterium SCGC AG-212-C10]